MWVAGLVGGEGSIPLRAGEAVSCSHQVSLSYRLEVWYFYPEYGSLVGIVRPCGLHHVLMTYLLYSILIYSILSMQLDRLKQPYFTQLIYIYISIWFPCHSRSSANKAVDISSMCRYNIAFISRTPRERETETNGTHKELETCIMIYITPFYVYILHPYLFA